MDTDLLSTQRRAILEAAAAEGLDEAVALRLATKTEQRVRLMHGGTACYLPLPGKTDRNQKIRDAFRRGGNLTRIAAQFGLSESRIRQIVAGRTEGR